ncbi:methyltransferase domain-containing protein [Candidatus Poribacteria bacterium]|nr:methyltransferase domain-containing protein [Candidatus Poribacteria bacterium]
MNKEIWSQAPSLTYRGITRNVPLQNFAGRNYLAYTDPILIAQLEIKNDERVLDVGGGAAPCSRADVVTDAYLDDDTHRVGKPTPKDKKYVECFAENLLFDDGEFDVAICKHVLEHAVDPEAACKEIARVARRGYIETPSPWSEYFYGYPPHRWMISAENGVLVFRPRPFIRSPFLNCLRWMEYCDADFSLRWNLEYRNLITTQFPWKGEIPYRIESGAGFNYDDPEQAFESHLSFVINALRFGGVPAGELEYEARAALKFRPQSAIAFNALGVVLRLARQNEKSQEAFSEACRLEPNDGVFRHNAQLPLNSSQCQLKLLPPEPADSGLPAEDFAGKVFYSGSREHDSLLATQLNIKDEEKVLDVMNQGNIFARTNFIVDVSGETLTYRSEKETRFLGCAPPSAFTAMPFPDGSLDVAIARDALAYMDHPSKLCSEIQRVARRGFIEVPHHYWEYVWGNPKHRWLCAFENGVLVFRRKPFAKIPFKSVMVPLVLKFPELRHRIEVSLRNVSFIQLAWEGRFDFRVEDDPACPYDYHRPKDALLAHIDCGYNLCNQGAPQAALPEAEAALAIDGNHPDSLNMRGLIAWASGHYKEGLEHVRRAAELAPENKTIAENFRFMREKYTQISANKDTGDKQPRT